MVNDFCHLELGTSDLEGAKKFYGELFGWKLEPHMSPAGEYTMISPGKGPGGGMMQHHDGNVPPQWMVYITVENVDDYLEKAKGLGAKEIMGKTQVEEMGWFAVLTDPQGAPFAIWENKE